MYFRSLCIGAFFALLLITSGNEGSGAERDSNSVVCDRINGNIKIQGRLGEPLGNILAIKGNVADNPTANRKIKSDGCFVAVHSVGGNKIAPPILIECRALTGKLNFQKGSSINCVGFETGGFEGIPSDAFQYIPPVTAQEFHFRAYFVVIKQL